MPLIPRIIIALIAAGSAHAIKASIWETNEGDTTTYLSTGDKALTRGPDADLVPDDGSGATYVFNVDPSATYQEFLGFGSSFEGSSTYNMNALSEGSREALIESIVDPVKGIGLNLFRICIGSSDFTEPPFYTYEDTQGSFSLGRDNEHIIPALKIAMQKNPDVLFFASPWSPPAWMKDSGTLLGGNMVDAYFDAYADYIVSFIQAYEAEGIPIYAVTPQNEPRLSKPTYPTCYWTAEQERDFIRILGPKFVQNNIATKIWIWDHNWDKPERDFPYIVLGDTEANQYVDGTGWHHYRGDPVTQTNVHNAHPDKHQYFTEGSKFGTQGARELLDILRNWSRSYNAWVTFIDKDGQPNPGPYAVNPTMVVYNKNPADPDDIAYTFDYFSYGQFAKFIQRGAVRIGSEEGGSAVGSVAFKNPDDTVVVVVVNAGNAPKSVKISYDGSMIKRDVGKKTVLTFRWAAEGPPAASPAPSADSTESPAPSASPAPSRSPSEMPSASPSRSSAPVAPSGGPAPLSVASTAMEIQTRGPNWEAVATVVVANEAASPVGGVQVLGSWSGLVDVGVTQAITGPNGEAVLNSGKTRETGMIQFCVDDLVLDGHVYDATVPDCASIAN